MTSMKLNLKTKLNDLENDILSEEGFLRNSYEVRERPLFGHYDNLRYDRDFKYYDLNDMKPEVRQAKRLVQEACDQDVLELKKKKWNSITTNDKTLQKKPELKQTLFEVGHGFKDVKHVKLKKQKIIEGVDTRDHDLGWKVSNQWTQQEMKRLSFENHYMAKKNSHDYWSKIKSENFNDEDLFNEEVNVGVGGDEDLSIGYVSPQKDIEQSIVNFRRIKKNIAIPKEVIKKQTIYENPSGSPEKIDAIVFKRCYPLIKHEVSLIKNSRRQRNKSLELQNMEQSMHPVNEYIELIKSKFEPTYNEEGSNEENRQRDIAITSNKQNSIKSPKTMQSIKSVKSMKTIKRRSNSQIENLFQSHEHIHPGTWMLFPFETDYAWSCCLNSDKESGGCTKVKIPF